MMPSPRKEKELRTLQKDRAGGADEQARLEELKARIERFKETQSSRRKGEAGAARDAGAALNAAVRLLAELAAGIAFGLFIGYWLDRWAGTRPLFIVLFLLIGLAAAVRNIMRGEMKTRGSEKDAETERAPLHSHGGRKGETCGNPPNDV